VYTQGQCVRMDNIQVFNAYAHYGITRTLRAAGDIHTLID